MKNQETFRKALVTAGIPDKAAGHMLTAFVVEDLTLRKRFERIRLSFNQLKEDSWLLWKSQRTWFTMVQRFEFLVEIA